MPRRKFYSFYVRAAIDRGPWSGLRNSRDQNHAHIYFVIFPWLALYVALVYPNPSVDYAVEDEENYV